MLLTTVIMEHISSEELYHEPFLVLICLNEQEIMNQQVKFQAIPSNIQNVAILIYLQLTHRPFPFNFHK